MSTINPADCDRTTVYTGECRNFQDTEWITFDSGRRRSPDASDRNTWLVDVGFGSLWVPDHKVRNLVRLVPARPMGTVRLVPARPMGTWTRDDLPDFSGVDWRAMYEVASRERDEAERERDEAVRRVDDVLRRATHAEGNLLSMTSGRDEWKERAEDAEQKYGTERLRWERAREHHADESRKWGEKRRAYEAQIAELEVDAADDDPIVYAVRESDVAAVKIELDSHGEPFADGEHVYTDSAADARNLAGGHIQKAIRRFAVARAIEAGQSVTPVQKLAREYAEAVGIDWANPEPEDVDLLMKVAEHVIGQEADQ